MATVLSVGSQAVGAAQTTAARFEEDVLRSPIPVLVDMWASWCAPCRGIAPHIDRLAEEYKDRIRVLKLNVDQNPGVQQRYGVMGIPALLLFSDGKVIDRVMGAYPSKVQQMLQRHAQGAQEGSGETKTQETVASNPTLDQLIRRRT